MATFSFQSPDGKQYSLNGPDGATPDQAFAVLQQHLKQSSPITTNNLVRAAAEGVPIAGGLLNKLEAGTNALFSYGLNPLFNEKDQLTGSLAERYEKSLAEQNAMSENFQQEHPIASTAAGLVGGTAATLPFAGVGGALPAGVTRVGQAALGMGGRTLGGQMVRGAASGAGLNAADALIRGDDPGVAAGIGGAIGAAVPGGARLGGAIGSRVASTVRGVMNPAEEAARRTGYAIDAAQRTAQAAPGSQYNPNPLTPQEMDQLVAQGQPAMVLDVAGEHGRALARSAANQSPEARAILNSAVDNRFETQAPRFEAQQQANLNFPTQAARDAAIQDVRTRVYQPAYETAWQDSSGTPLWPDNTLINERAEDFDRWQELAQRSHMGPPLNADERAEFRNLQNRRNGAGPLPAFTPVQLNALNSLRRIAQAPEVQKAMNVANIENSNWAVLQRRAAPQDPLEAVVREGAPAGAPPTVGPTQTASGATNLPSLWWWDRVKRALDASGDGTAAMYARNLRGALDQLVPTYADARAAAAPHLWFDGAQNAYEAGQNFINRGARLGPDAQTQLNRMDPVERELFEDGYTNALTQRVNGIGDRQNITARIYNNGNVRDEITTALGPQRAGQIEANLHLENLYDASRKALQGNSTTMRQMVELGLAGGTGLIEGGNPANWDSETIAHAALVYAAARGHAHVEQRVAAQVARLLTSNNPANARLGLNWVQRNPRLMNGLRAMSTSLARAGAVQAQPSPQ